MPEECDRVSMVKVLACYGRLAAELENTADPARAARLRARLAELDACLDHLVARTERHG